MARSGSFAMALRRHPARFPTRGSSMRDPAAGVV